MKKYLYLYILLFFSCKSYNYDINNKEYTHKSSFYYHNFSDYCLEKKKHFIAFTNKKSVTHIIDSERHTMPRFSVLLPKGVKRIRAANHQYFCFFYREGIIAVYTSDDMGAKKDSWSHPYVPQKEEDIRQLHIYLNDIPTFTLYDKESILMAKNGQGYIVIYSFKEKRNEIMKLLINNFYLYE